MLSKSPGHPDPGELAAFALGNLTEDRSGVIEGHLAACDSCHQILEAVPEDKLVSLFRSAGSSGKGAEPAPRLVPGFEILEEIGRGGMGVVYKARQVGLDRVVALKRIRTEGLPGPEDLSRFQREAQAAARLRHPNVVEIYEVGEQDGFPYLAMEFVSGGSLADHLARGPLAGARAAELLETLATAMHFVHQNGVVHRDLKPANILMSGEWRVVSGEKGDLPRGDAAEEGSVTPKISDFGLAKYQGAATGQTRSGAVLGTPSYMAPEQAGVPGEAVGPAVDVYALGAILYECLTGRPPFKAATLLETLELVRVAEPVNPSRLQPNLPRDLQTICLKCLEKDPRRRYASGAELADDLGRFRDGIPVRARPVGPLPRLAKWARRRPAAAGLVGLSAAVTIGLVAGVLVHNARLQTAVKRAEAAMAEARRQQERADASVDQTRATLQKILLRVRGKRDSGIPQLLELQKTVLEDALAYYRENFDGQDHPDPAVRAAAALSYREAADVEQSLGRRDQAESHYLRAINLLEGIRQERPAEKSYIEALWGCFNNMGILCVGQARYDQAEGYFLKLLEIDRLLPRDLSGPSGTTCINLNLGSMYLASGKRPQAEAALTQARGSGEAALHEFPGDLPLHSVLAKVYTNLALIDMGAGRLEQAEDECRRAEALLRPIVGETVVSEDAVRTLGPLYANWGNLLSGTARFKEAVETVGKGIALLNDLLKREPGSAAAKAYLWKAHGTRGDAFAAWGHYAEAIRDYDRALSLAEKESERVMCRRQRFLPLARAGDHTRGVAEALALAALDQKPDDLFTMAKTIAAAAGVARHDVRLPAAERPRVAEKYTAIAVAALGRLRSAGYFDKPANQEHLQKDPELESIRTQEAFRKFLAETMAAAPGK